MTEPGPAPFALRMPPALKESDHKGSVGRVLAIAGSRTMPGAGVLVARAAQRGGAGLVVAAMLDAELATSLILAAPEAVLAPLADVDPNTDATAAGLLDTLAQRDPHAWLFGPGVGDDGRARLWLNYLLDSGSSRPLLLDADALNAVDGQPERFQRYLGPLVLTPHPGEAARLLGRSIPAEEAGRIASARELADRSGAIVCLKGAGTVVTDGIDAYVNRTGNPGMATAGSGDVLSGLMLALLAAFRETNDASTAREGARDAALLAVHLHGLAGDLAAGQLGQRALIASDLIRALPAAWRQLEAGG